MTEDESIVIKPRQPFSETVLPQSADELAKFMDQPITAIAETITGALAAGPKAWTVMTGHIVQSILKARLFQQVGREIKELREKGKIPSDFADENKHKYANSWVELLTIIDEETPDADRLEALKAMFYSVNKVNATDGEKIVAYQLFQMAKKVTSGQLLYLKVCYDLNKRRLEDHLLGLKPEQWFTEVGKRLGHQVIALLQQDDRALTDFGLLTVRDKGVREITRNEIRVSQLGIEFCKNIETYYVETSPSTEE